jgi:hypothetical protein
MHKFAGLSLVVLTVMMFVAIDRLAYTQSVWWALTVTVCAVCAMLMTVVGIATDNTEY